VVFAKRRPRERAALLGTCVGYEAAALPLALSQAVFGLQGLQLAALFGLFNCISGSTTPSASLHVCLSVCLSATSVYHPGSLFRLSIAIDVPVRFNRFVKFAFTLPY
jgi:hypothetical protein